MTRFNVALWEIGTYKEILRSQVLQNLYYASRIVRSVIKCFFVFILRVQSNSAYKNIVHVLLVCLSKLSSSALLVHSSKGVLK
uniref:Uncharacterized protein n=1 Tax=Physcomitrium patens TaxID=3218 RepID=A0A2K1L0B6_PHYPA|nr:hypothetical protein PHYPA_002256 [Physcomitrium patens]